jgi:PEP-CTERM motif
MKTKLTLAAVIGAVLMLAPASQATTIRGGSNYGQPPSAVPVGDLINQLPSMTISGLPDVTIPAGFTEGLFEPTNFNSCPSSDDTGVCVLFVTTPSDLAAGTEVTIALPTLSDISGTAIVSDPVTLECNDGNSSAQSLEASFTPWISVTDCGHGSFSTTETSCINALDLSSSANSVTFDVPSCGGVTIGIAEDEAAYASISTLPPTATPEPGSLLLSAMGLFGLLAFGRRLRAKPRHALGGLARDGRYGPPVV